MLATWLNVAIDREHAGEAVRQRRLALGLSARAAAAEAGMARNTWTALEAGTQRMLIHRYVDVERVLRWAPGSVEAVLRGEDPVELPVATTPEEPTALDAEIARIIGLNLPAETRLTMLRALIEIHAQVAAERAERAG